MNKSDKTNWNISFEYLFFDCFQLGSKVLRKLLKELIFWYSMREPNKKKMIEHVHSLNQKYFLAVSSTDLFISALRIFNTELSIWEIYVKHGRGVFQLLGLFIFFI